MEDLTMQNAKRRVLLVEDDKLDQMAFMRLVENEGLAYDCTITGSVSEARSVLAGSQFDIIISDYSLGDGTAFDVLDLVKDTPVILVTGAGDEEVAIKAWRAGACDYLIKDIERNYLKTVPITVENAIEHKKTQERLQLLSGAIMSTEESVYITDMNDKIIFVNRAFCKTYGYSEREVIGKSGSVVWMEKTQNKYTRSVFQTRTAGNACKIAFYHRRKDGSVFPVSLSRSIIKDSKGNSIAVVGVARDISDYTVMEDELRTAHMELRGEKRPS
jgi:PAS domain S-box-containing protein